MKKLNIIIITILVGLSACTDKFAEINTNPNATNSIDPAYLFTTSQRRGAMDDRVYYYTRGMACFETQMYANTNYTKEHCTDRYQFNGAWNGTLWGAAYAGDASKTYLSYVAEAEKIAQKNGWYNKEATCAIWKSFLFLQLTDVFGDIPYSEAFNDLIDYPKYDTQENIYSGIYTKLKESNTKLDATKGNGMGNADLFYGGDYGAWKRFSNSVRLRMAMRISNVNPTLAKTWFDETMADAAGLMINNSQSCRLKTDPAGPQGIHSDNPIKVMANAFDWYRISEFMVSTLNTLQDPRMFNFAEPTKKYLDAMKGICSDLEKNTALFNTLTFAEQEKVSYFAKEGSSFINVYAQGRSFTDEIDAIIARVLPARVTEVNRNIKYRGVRNGQSIESLTSMQSKLGEYSDLSQYLRQNNYQTNLFVFPEVCFLLAEANLNGWTTPKTAEEHYNDGIRAAMQLYEVPETEITTYLAGAAKYKSLGTKAQRLEQIILQKYLGNYTDGFEAYADLRRTGYPQILPIDYVTSVADEMGLPRRWKYPSDEHLLNKDNVIEAANRMGGDYQQSRMWWDKNN
ncbi:MAG: SusD/RagB family nutrient-binding outer membrane lipoprotein [Paludibacter sp.]|nr:SusD/RagB family nutrient-binding outer membrane lipoprotein [Paludibacter sp.]